MSDKSQPNRIKISKELANCVEQHLSTLADAKYHGQERNEKVDKVDFSITYKGQHYWLVLLREGKKVPISKGLKGA